MRVRQPRLVCACVCCNPHTIPSDDSWIPGWRCCCLLFCNESSLIFFPRSILMPRGCRTIVLSNCAFFNRLRQTPHTTDTQTHTKRVKNAPQPTRPLLSVTVCGCAPCALPASTSTSTPFPFRWLRFRCIQTTRAPRVRQHRPSIMQPSPSKSGETH